MSSFAYQAVDRSGKRVSDTLEAADQSAAIVALRERGLTVVKLQEGGKATRSGIKFEIGSGVKARDLTLFSRQFATMVASGLTILRCLMILEAQVTSAKLKETIGLVASDIESGHSLSDSMEKHPKVFDKLYISMIRAGEIGGVLDMTLQRISTELEARDSLRRKIKSAMTYPTVVLIFALLTTIGMLLFLIPTFAKMYETLGSDLPSITQLLVNLSNALKKNPFLILIAIVPPPVAFKAWKNTEMGRRQWDRIKLRFPMKIGAIVQKVALARFSRTLSSLIASGVPMMTAVRVTGDTAGNSVIEDAMDDIIKNIEEGRSFSEPLKGHPIFPPMVIQMAMIGEETGQMDAMLEKVAEFYEDEVDASVKALTSIIEPLMMVFVGAIVGFVIVAMYLPMFQLFDKIK